MTESTNPDSVYCPKCGTRLAQRNNDVPVCPACGRVAYADPKFAAAAVIPYDGGIVLVRRAIEPGLGMWSFPSGYVNRGETPSEAVEREVREECGLIVSADWVIGIYATAGQPVVLGVYNADVLGGELIAGDETLAARVFPADDLPKMAFAYDDQIVEDWRKAGVCEARPAKKEFSESLNGCETASRQLPRPTPPGAHNGRPYEWLS